MKEEDKEIQFVKEKHPHLLDLPSASEAVHDDAYEVMNANLEEMTDKVKVFIDPKIGGIGGLISTRISKPVILLDFDNLYSQIHGRIDIVVNEEVGNLVKTSTFDCFNSQNGGQGTPEDYLRYTITHEYCHLFEIFNFNRITKRGSTEHYKGYNPFAFNLQKKEILAVGEAFSYWLADSITKLNGFDVEANYPKLDRRLLFEFYFGLREGELQGRDYVLDHTQEILEKSVENVRLRR